jgi:dephospho-CoA kinase
VVSVIICVTGKIATGKSTVSKFFVNHGFEYINVDHLGHAAFELNLERIENTFGKSDRKEIAKIVFNDSEKLKLLESIVHPTMMELLNENIKKSEGKNIVVEAAIKRRLGIKCCDLTITVVADENIIKERLKGRYDEKLVEEILKRQSDIEPEGIILENNSNLEELLAKLEKIYNEYIAPQL